MLDHMRSALKINVLAVEYPGYGIYKTELVSGNCTPSEASFFRDASLVFNFVADKVTAKNVIVLGRSLGSS